MSHLRKRLTKLERDTGADKGRIFVCEMLAETWNDETVRDAALDAAFAEAGIVTTVRDAVIFTGIPFSDDVLPYGTARINGGDTSPG